MNREKLVAGSCAQTSFALSASRGSDAQLGPCPTSWLHRSCFDIFTSVVAAHSDRRAIVDDQRHLTYREVHDEALRLAGRFVKITSPSEPIAIALPNCANFPVTMMAALAAGRPYLPLDLSFPEIRNAYILKHSGVRAVVVDDQTRGIVTRIAPELAQIEFVDTESSDVEMLPIGSPEAIAYVLYTSGSTGNPKGVFYEQRSLVRHAMSRIDSIKMSTDDRLALVFAPTVAAAQPEIFGALLSGATLFPVDIRRNGLQELARVVGRERISLICCIPSVMRRLLELSDDPKLLQSVRQLCTTGERIFKSYVECFRQRLPPSSLISIGLGSSETQWITRWSVPANWTSEAQLMPVGFPVEESEVALVDTEGMPVKPGEVGEITVSGRYIARGYWNDDALNQRGFTVLPGDSGKRKFMTGDLGRFGDDGLLELIGRKDRQLKIRGNRIEPAEVEGRLSSHPAVMDAAVVPRACGESLELIAYVVLQPGHSVQAAELSEWLRPLLSDAMWPREIHVIDEIPTLGNFKHDHFALLEIDRRRSESNGAPKSVDSRAEVRAGSTKQAVDAAWRRLLGDRALKLDLSWSVAGGDSLQGLELILQLEQTLGRRVDIAALGPSTRPSELVATLDRSDRDLRAQEPDVSKRERPQIFWAPGVGGPDLTAVRLADTLSKLGDVVMLDYLPVDPARLHLVSFEDVVAGVVRQIRATATPGEPLRLLGYSLGGIAAFEAASILSSEGRSVEFVCLLDSAPATINTRVPSLIERSLVRDAFRRNSLGWLRRINLSRLFELLVERQLQRGHFSILAAEWRTLNSLQLRHFSLILRHIATQYVRGRALSRYAITGRLKRICLIRAADNPDWSEEPADLGWNRFADEVHVWTVPGHHYSFLDPTNVEATRDAIVAAWATCRSSPSA